ncbi:hypothetical protein M141_1972 [Bacteroides fragilis str. S38L5]|nr:hypothetical protein M087_4002 [Bacteroides fragilis str. S23 R14]EXZ99666.1 hypothetical protein M087_2791 [Bacteroides fragilis str. S23 R14]EYA01559.1 hypothetical protein M087_0810 [Bacteroides fragilis str. S23 R14]EYA95840.1 hypothetical protein M141_1972 [Bacteroides fragilis str. S38L5]
MFRNVYPKIDRQGKSWFIPSMHDPVTEAAKVCRHASS